MSLSVFTTVSLLAIDCVKHLVACISLHVVSGLVEITNSESDSGVALSSFYQLSVPWYVILPGLAHHPPRVVNDDGRVPDCVSMVLVSLQDRRHNHHPIPGRKLQRRSLSSTERLLAPSYIGQEHCRGPGLRRLCKLCPGMLLSRAESKWHSLTI